MQFVWSSSFFDYIVERSFSINKDFCIGILSAIQEINDDPSLDDVGTSPITGK